MRSKEDELRALNRLIDGTISNKYKWKYLDEHTKLSHLMPCVSYIDDLILICDINEYKYIIISKQMNGDSCKFEYNIAFHHSNYGKLRLYNLKHLEFKLIELFDVIGMESKGMKELISFLYE